MKHPRMISLLLVLLFFAAQCIGLVILARYMTFTSATVDGAVIRTVAWKALPFALERPSFAAETSYLPFLILILVGTALVYLIFRFRLGWLWKTWFFLSVFFCLSIAFAAFFSSSLALVLSLVLTFLRVFHHRALTHNLTELFLYGGLAAIFVPVFSILSISILLILIAIYDAVAVWKTKHMVVLAEAQTATQQFAGLLIPYQKKRVAILGGGDIGFPLLFTGVYLLQYGFAAVIISVTTTTALATLLWFSKKNTYYPAMPFLAAGCFLGAFFFLFL